MKIKPPFKSLDNRYLLSSWIISLFPENYPELTYLEPFAGAWSILINKTPSKMEVLNDLDGNLIPVFQAIRDEPKVFTTRLKRVKYCEETFKRAQKRSKKTFDDYLDFATNEYILRRMSRGGQKKTFKSGCSTWESFIKNLPKISERIRDVHIFNKPAIELVEIFNSPDVFLYADPPALPDEKKENEPEMSTEDHIQLARTLLNFRGKVAISAQPSPLYNRLYKEWKCHKKKVPGKSKPKTVALWCNF